MIGIVKADLNGSIKSLKTATGNQETTKHLSIKIKNTKRREENENYIKEVL